jgi:hypothetical protein
LRAARQKRLVLALIAAVLATRAVCVCAAPSAATITATRAPHACCHPQAAPGHHERRGEACQHCSHAQLTPPDGFQMAAPTWTVVPFCAPAHALVSGRRLLVTLGPSARDVERPPPAATRSCVLRL